MIDTLENVKNYLDITGDDYDTILTDFCTQADEIIKNFLCRDIEESSYVEYYDGNGKSKLILRQMPVTTLTKVEHYDGSSYVEKDTDDYDRALILHDENGIYLDGYTFVKGTYNYRITYTAGYSSTTMPEVIKLAFKKLVQLVYDESPLKNRTLGKLSKIESGAGGSLIINIDLKAQERILETIHNYRRLNV